MPDFFQLKCTKFNFGWGCAPDPTGESPSSGWVGASCPLSKNTHPLSALQASIQLFPRPHHLSSLNQKVKMPMCPRTPRYPLMNWYPPLFRPTLRPDHCHLVTMNLILTHPE